MYGERFGTGVTGPEWVNRGHHPPVLIRGGRWVTKLNCPPGDPMGMGLGVVPEVCREQLEPGDRLVLYTVGITEARTAAGDEFGLPGFMEFPIRHHADRLPVPEPLCRLVNRVVTHNAGELGDDAAVLFCEWLGCCADGSDLAAAVAGVPLVRSVTGGPMARAAGMPGGLPRPADVMAPDADA